MTSGSEQLARVLYETHGPALERWASNRFNDGHLAEEVVQETVLSAWRKYDQFDPGRGSERAWMFGIARNVAANRHQRSLRHLRSVPTEHITDAGIEDAEFSRITEKSLIVDAINALSSEHREVVAAAYWEGLSTKQISRRVGIPDGTVKSRLHYALRILRVQLEEREVLT